MLVVRPCGSEVAWLVSAGADAVVQGLVSVSFAPAIVRARTVDDRVNLDCLTDCRIIVQSAAYASSPVTRVRDRGGVTAHAATGLSV